MGVDEEQAVLVEERGLQQGVEQAEHGGGIPGQQQGAALRQPEIALGEGVHAFTPALVHPRGDFVRTPEEAGKARRADLRRVQQKIILFFGDQIAHLPHGGAGRRGVFPRQSQTRAKTGRKAYCIVARAARPRSRPDGRGGAPR